MNKARKNRKKTYRYGLILLLALILGGLFVKGMQKYDATQYSEDYVSLEEVRQELTFGVYEKAEWERYFAVYHRDILTREILAELLDTLCVADYIEYGTIGVNQLVSREEWNQVYAQILDLIDSEKEVMTQQILFLDVIEAEEGSILVTNLGEFTTLLPIEYFTKWQAYEIYSVENRIAGIAKICEEELYISNAYMTNYKDDKITFLYMGTSYEKEIGTLGAKVEEGVCDIVLKEGEISALRMKNDVIAGELLSYDDTSIEIVGYGRIEHSGRLPVYQIYGEVTERALSDIVLGNMEVSYVTGENQVCAILIKQPADIADIRVLLLAEDGTNYRKNVYLKCNTNATVRCGEKEESLPSETLIFAEDFLAADSMQTLSITPDFTEGQLIFCDAQGNAISNGYQGTLEIRRYNEGYTVVNDVPFETYLTAVVPSEMPSNYAPEALKAQAVCARSYAYIQLLRADLAKLGAHINDSTSYQVYNKVAATDASRTAVAETAGQMLTYQGHPVEAFYFSTSMGYTDTEEVWNVETPYGYLKSTYLNTVGARNDLSTEEAFLSYISQGGSGYDSDIKFYRWFAKADYSDKTKEINQILMNRYYIAPRHIQFFTKDDSKVDEVNQGTLDKFGAIKQLTVTERSAAGSILTLCITYEKGKVLVKNEYNIRNVLGCGIEKMVYADATENTSVTMLPSAFCALTKQADGSILLQGGGYGHGLGMSQNAANGMAKAGMNYEEILYYFYKDIEIANIQ